jgi:hypothetical protein
VSHSICTHRGRVDSRLLVVESQTANLTPSLSFWHNLCCRCPNGLYETIFDIYTSITFQWNEERLKARYFDPYNRTLKFWESRRTPKSPFRECECHPHTFPKVGLRHYHSPKCTHFGIGVLANNGIKHRSQHNLVSHYNLVNKICLLIILDNEFNFYGGR